MTAPTPQARLVRPLVSVITPTLNQAQYLEETLSSVAAQTYARVEHIVVDGGSTDGTQDILEVWGREPDRRWLSEADGGMYEAVNKGVALANGDVLAYLNSDDGWFPWTAEAAVAALDADALGGFVFGDVLNIEDLSGRGTIGFYPVAPAGVFRRSGRLGQPAVLWRKSAQEAVGSFNTELKYAADTEFFTRLTERVRGVRVNEVLAWEREYPSRASQAMAELLAAEMTQLRAPHLAASPAARRAQRWRDRASMAARHRRLALLFLSRAGSSGHWPRFGSSHLFAVQRHRLAASLLPILGRRYVRYVQRAAT